MRITGGTFRSRALKAPRGQATRPTSDRVREALFSMLASEGVFDPADENAVGDPAASPGANAGVRVLDLYAGTGALAFEALSRGAASAVLVEQGREAIAAIRDNARSLCVEARVRLVVGRVEQVLARQVRALGPFDLVFVDPPYADVRTPAFAALLSQAADLLRPGGCLVLEHASPDAPPELASTRMDRTRHYGDTALTFHWRS